MFQNAQVILGLNFIRAGGRGPFSGNFGALQQALGLLEFSRRDDQRRNALFPGPTRAARTVQKDLGV